MIMIDGLIALPPRAHTRTTTITTTTSRQLVLSVRRLQAIPHENDEQNTDC
jgi:hypothetical protein